MDVDKAADYLNNLKEWKLDWRVKERLKDSGFDGLLRLTTFPVKHDLQLLSALVESYDDDNRCFIVNNHKLVYGLEDILHLIGLPIDGKPVTGIDPKSQQFSKKYLGSCNPKYKKSGSTSFVWLKQKFEKVPENIDINSPEIEPYVRAFLLYLIGSIVVPDRSGTSVPLMYLSLMEKLEDIKEYAWGAAMLAHLHVSMSSFKQQYSLFSKNVLRGHSYALMVFAMERIPKLVPTACLSGKPNSFPLLEGWTKLLRDSANNFERDTTKHDYLQILGELQESDIDWQPYSRLPCDFLPQYYAGQEKIGRSRTILLCFEKAVYHRPDLSPKQFGIQNVNTSKLRNIIDLDCKRRVLSLEINWSKYSNYGLYEEEWKNRNSCIIEEHAASSQAPDDSDSLLAKRKRVDCVDQENTVKKQITQGNIATNHEYHFESYTESHSVKLVHTALVAPHIPSSEIFDLPSEDEEDDTIREEGTLDELLSAPNYSCLGAASSEPPRALPHDLNTFGHLHLDYHRLVDQNTSTFDRSAPIGVTLSQSLPHRAPPQVCSIKKECDDVLDELDVLNDLLQDCDPTIPYAQPSTVHDEVDSAKEAIKTILCQGLDALKDSQVRNAFLASSKILLSDPAFPSDLKTELNELQNHTSTFLEVKDISTASEISSLKKFLEQEVKVPAVKEQLRRADDKVACIRAKLDTVCERRDKMNEVATNFMNMLEGAKQKVATAELVRKCYSSWSDFAAQFSSYL